MPSNKHKKSTPRKSAQHSSPHKSQKSRKPHRSPRDNFTQSKASNPIFDQKHAAAARPIPPPTRRLLFPQCSNSGKKNQPFSSPIKREKGLIQGDEQQPFSSPFSKKDNRHMNIHMVVEKPRVKMETDEDHGYDTPSPHSRKRKASAHKHAPERCDSIPLTMAPPPSRDVSVVIPMKRRLSSSCSSTLPNPAAVSQVNVAVLRHEKEELQRRLDASAQEAREAKRQAEESRKTAEEWSIKYQAATSEDVRIQREHKEGRHQTQITLLTEKCHQSNQQVAQLTQKISTLQAQQSASQKLKSRSDHLEATNRLLAKQIAQLQTAAQSHAQEISHLKQESAHPAPPNPALSASLRARESELQQQVAQLTSDLDFQHELASQAARTHALETSALNQQIAHLRAQFEDRTRAIARRA
ncbi:hypothetical protein EYC84_003787 [Monilinia fructicola]|uniref:Uncharacterized protein n=1 Tax=Monilinia fructicola TaxID=38448 RepID=A0A5M9JYS1_MONFR|nr:hypothetical protein EYC84_003787 [Monilinia fructicola]